MLQEELFERQRGRVHSEIDHDRYVRLAASRNRPGHRIPFRTAVVGDLDPHDHAGVLADPHRREPRVHVGEVLLDRAAFHARPHDVDEREHARSRAVDDLLLELGEVPPSGAAHVDERRLSAAERVAVRLDGGITVTQVRVLLRPEEHMGVDVDEAGHDMESGGVGDPSRQGRIDVGSDAGNLRSAHRHVHDGVDAVLRVENAAVLDQEIELGSLGIQSWDGQSHQAEHRTTSNME